MLCASSCDKELTATLHSEQYNNFLAFSSSDSETLIALPLVLFTSAAGNTAVNATSDLAMKDLISAISWLTELLAFNRSSSPRNKKIHTNYLATV